MSVDTLYIYLESETYKKGILIKYSKVFNSHKIFDTTPFCNFVAENNFRMPRLSSKRYYDFDAQEIDSTTFLKKKSLKEPL